MLEKRQSYSQKPKVDKFPGIIDSDEKKEERIMEFDSSLLGSNLILPPHNAH